MVGQVKIRRSRAWVILFSVFYKKDESMRVVLVENAVSKAERILPPGKMNVRRQFLANIPLRFLYVLHIQPSIFTLD